MRAGIGGGMAHLRSHAGGRPRFQGDDRARWDRRGNLPRDSSPFRARSACSSRWRRRSCRPATSRAPRTPRACRTRVAPESAGVDVHREPGLDGEQRLYGRSGETSQGEAELARFLEARMLLGMALLAEGNAQQATSSSTRSLRRTRRMPARASFWRRSGCSSTTRWRTAHARPGARRPARRHAGQRAHRGGALEAGREQSVCCSKKCCWRIRKPRTRLATRQRLSTGGGSRQGGGAAAQGRRKRRRHPARGRTGGRHRGKRRHVRGASRNRIDARRQPEEPLSRQPCGGLYARSGDFGAARRVWTTPSSAASIRRACCSRSGTRMERGGSQGGDRGDRHDSSIAAWQRGRSHGRGRNRHGQSRGRRRAHTFRSGARGAPGRSTRACGSRTCAAQRGDKNRRTSWWANGRARAQAGGSAQRRGHTQPDFRSRRPERSLIFARPPRSIRKTR